MLPTITNHQELFSPSWADRFCRKWNSRPELWPPFQGLGCVCFTLAEDIGSRVILSWDIDGTVTYLDTASPHISCPEFIGCREGWLRFIRGEFPPVEAVLARVITYHGSTAFALGNGPKFASVQLVASQLLLLES